MKKFYPVGCVHDLAPGKGKKIRVMGKSLALFKYENNIYAIQNACPHQHADLARGYLKDGKVYCALHHWAFDLSSGAYSLNQKLSIKTFEVQIRDEIIFIGID